MGSILQQLQNNQAVLLMYLAGEFSPEDRAAVEQRLAGDAELRAELAQLQEAQNSVTANLQHLDETSPLPAAADVALRRVSRMMKQRQLDKLMAKPAQASRPRRHIPWWAYAAATAAAAVVAVIVWWGMQSDVVVPANTVAVVTSEDENKHLEEQVNLLEMTMRNVDENSSITEAENDARILVARKGENDQPLSLSILGTGEQAQ
jgi:anti-sigma factor RsiW